MKIVHSGLGILLAALAMRCAAELHSRGTVAIVERLQAFESLIPVVPDSVVELYKRFDPSTFHRIYEADLARARLFIDSMNASLPTRSRIDTLAINHALEFFASAHRQGNTIHLSSSYFFLFDDPSVIRSVLSHEFGHVHHDLLPPSQRDTLARVWNELERHALFYLFRDGEYSGNAKFGGHPYESPAELFASAFNLFLNRREELNVRMRYIDRELYPLIGRLRKVVRAAGIQ